MEWDKEIKLQGCVVSIDICGYTAFVESNFKNNNDYESTENLDNAYYLVKKLIQVVLNELEGTNGQIIRYTGDGALVFFEGGPNQTAADEAVAFGISVCNLWKKCRNWFPEFKDINIRITMDYGNIKTNSYGGLWSGHVICCASKISETEKGAKIADKVTITQRVRDMISDNNFLKKMFLNIGKSKSESENEKVDIYQIDYLRYCSKFKGISPKLEKTGIANITVCLLGTGNDSTRLLAVLDSIKYQTFEPKQILVAVSEKLFLELKLLGTLQQNSKNNIEYIVVNANDAKNRSYVRNRLLTKVSGGVELVCFLDGDTLLASKCLEIAQKIHKSNPYTVFCPERLEVDEFMEKEDLIKIVSKMFITESRNIDPTVSWSGFYYHPYSKDEKKPTLKDEKNPTLNITSFSFLASYALFVPRILLEDQRLGEWDENFVGWGEEDIDYTYRLYKLGCHFFVPPTVGFVSFHLNHIKDGSSEDLSELIRNIGYLRRKSPELGQLRRRFFDIVGIA